MPCSFCPQADRQKGILANSHTDRLADRKVDRQTDRQIDRQTDAQTDTESDRGFQIFILHYLVTN